MKNLKMMFEKSEQIFQKTLEDILKKCKSDTEKEYVESSLRKQYEKGLAYRKQELIGEQNRQIKRRRIAKMNRKHAKKCCK